ncbi:recombination protein NinB [Zavarzinella formosa]|uniref:recombination protein NinB n=1 Tax=Zavarzinella formosa TaxID=360055 RepID=UPI0002FCDDF3|nr:recombination protein NinB [Zavarzinella formosa]
MDALEFSTLVENGRLPDHVARKVGAAIRQFTGKRIVISVREAKRGRSLAQNALLWSCVYPPIVAAFREAGNMVDAQDVHEFLKQRVGRLRQVIVCPKTGEVMMGPGSTRRLSKTEMTDYIHNVVAWAAEVLDLEIQLPV